MTQTQIEAAGRWAWGSDDKTRAAELMAERDSFKELAVELLVALKDLHTCHRTFSGADNWTSLDDAARTQAEAVIAKAESR